jgi:hypothetical protein
MEIPRVSAYNPAQSNKNKEVCIYHTSDHSITRGSKKLWKPVLTLKQGYFAFRYIHTND